MSIINKAEALERLAGDEELYTEIAEVFREDAPKTLGLLRAAIASRVQPEAERLSHSLKSASASVGAMTFRELAAAMEQAAKKSAWSELDESIVRLDALMTEVLLAL